MRLLALSSSALKALPEEKEKGRRSPFLSYLVKPMARAQTDELNRQGGAKTCQTNPDSPPPWLHRKNIAVAAAGEHLPASGMAFSLPQVLEVAEAGRGIHDPVLELGPYCNVRQSVVTYKEVP